MNIISGTGDVLLAPDWHPAETAGPEAFRRLTADEIAYVPAIERIEHRVSIELDARDGAAFPMPPGRGGGNFDPRRQAVRNLDVQANAAEERLAATATSITSRRTTWSC